MQMVKGGKSSYLANKLRRLGLGDEKLRLKHSGAQTSLWNHYIFFKIVRRPEFGASIDFESSKTITKRRGEWAEISRIAPFF
jgi:hypothetical protein